MIYGSSDTADWDDAEIIVYNPETQKEYSLIFCGSTRPEEDREPYSMVGRGKINFIIREKHNGESEEDIDCR